MFTLIYGLLFGDIPEWARIMGYIFLCIEIVASIYFIYRGIKTGKIDIKDIIKYLISPDNKTQVMGFISDLKQALKGENIIDEAPANDTDNVPDEAETFQEEEAIIDDTDDNLENDEADNNSVIDVVSETALNNIVAYIKEWVMKYVDNKDKRE